MQICFEGFQNYSEQDYNQFVIDIDNFGKELFKKYGDKKFYPVNDFARNVKIPDNEELIRI